MIASRRTGSLFGGDALTWALARAERFCSCCCWHFVRFFLFLILPFAAPALPEEGAVLDAGGWMVGVAVQG